MTFLVGVSLYSMKRFGGDTVVRENADVKKAKKGDIDSLNRLFEQYYDVIYRYCYRHVRHKEAAQDITQEVFLRVCRHFSDYRHYGKFENYLYVIARNLCKDYFKRPVEYSLEDTELPLNTSDFSRIENRICIQQAMDRLPELEREIIYLRFDEDLKIKDIAKILGLQLSTTKYHLKKAQSLLQQEIRKGGNDNGRL